MYVSQAKKMSTRREAAVVRRCLMIAPRRRVSFSAGCFHHFPTARQRLYLSRRRTNNNIDHQCRRILRPITPFPCGRRQQKSMTPSTLEDFGPAESLWTPSCWRSAGAHACRPVQFLMGTAAKGELESYRRRARGGRRKRLARGISIRCRHYRTECSTIWNGATYILLYLVVIFDKK